MKYRKKPIVIEAFKWTGGPDQTEDPEWAIEAIKKGEMYFINTGTKKIKLMIKTLEGLMITRPGWYVIRGIEGEFYSCKPSIFEATHEAVE